MTEKFFQSKYSVLTFALYWYDTKKNDRKNRVEIHPM